MSRKYYFANGVRVKPCSREFLQRIAKEIRAALHLEKICKFPVIRFLEFMQWKFEDFEFEIVEKGVLPKGVFAWFNPSSGCVTICETYYKMANEGNGFARWTILHECLHYILHKDQIGALARQDNRPHKIYEDSEWQVNTLASELLMPTDLMNEKMSVEEISEIFGVSTRAAQCRLDRFQSSVKGGNDQHE